MVCIVELDASLRRGNICRCALKLSDRAPQPSRMTRRNPSDCTSRRPYGEADSLISVAKIGRRGRRCHTYAYGVVCAVIAKVESSFSRFYSV